MEKYLVISDWMIKVKESLKLDDTELMIFSMIYSFSQDGKSRYYGGVKYIQEFLKVTQPTAYRKLKSLEEKKLISCCEKGYFANIINLRKNYQIDKNDYQIDKNDYQIDKNDYQIENSKLSQRDNSYNKYNNTNNNKYNKVVEESTNTTTPNDNPFKDLKDGIIDALVSYINHRKVMKLLTTDNQINIWVKYLMKAQKFYDEQEIIDLINQMIVENQKNIFLDRLERNSHEYRETKFVGGKRIMPETDWLDGYIASL